MQKFISILFTIMGLWGTISAQTLSQETILLETPYGNMKLKLYEETPLQKANFLKLVKSGFYDSLLFHRVINEFMIQGGDHLSKKAAKGDSLGHGDIGYTIPAEINTKLIHKKGALCAAREGDDINPKYESSASQFYIVMGRKRTMEELKKYEDRINKSRYAVTARTFIKTPLGHDLKLRYNRLKNESKTDSAAAVNSEIEAMVKAEYLKNPEYKFNEQQITTYTQYGGTPHLDGTYTVFGEVVEGLEVIDKIATVKKDARDRPLQDVRIKMRVVN